MKFTLCMTLLAVPMLMGAGCEKSASEKSSASAAKAEGRCPHDIKQDRCPFCNPLLIESQGFCGEHGVAEALCYQCRPFLKTAFRAKGDWCKAHDAPESQCVTCHPELVSKAKPGSGHGLVERSGAAQGAGGECPHGIDRAKCPFCIPELIQSDGFCQEHNVAEALCARCRPYLVTAFKANRDWCTEHATPESQCVLCNPSLKNKQEAQHGATGEKP